MTGKTNLEKNLDVSKIKNVLNEEQYKIFTQAILRTIEGKADPTKIIKNIEKGFEKGKEAYNEMGEKEKKQVQSFWKQFEESSQKQLEKMKKKNEMRKSSDIEIQQIFKHLQGKDEGIFNKITELIQEKTGFDPQNPMKSLSKLMPGNKKQNQRKTVNDSDLEFGGNQAKSLIIGEAIGFFIGFSTISSIGYLFPVFIPLYAIHKMIPEGIIPILGGMKIDGLLSEGTIWNPITKETKMIVGNSDNKESTSYHTQKLIEERQQSNTNKQGSRIA